AGAHVGCVWLTLAKGLAERRRAAGERCAAGPPMKRDSRAIRNGEPRSWRISNGDRGWRSRTRSPGRGPLHTCRCRGGGGSVMRRRESRVSALAPPNDESEATMPGATEHVAFEAHIRPLFRQTDRQSMRCAFDLWTHADVVAHAAEILRRLENGSMPCDGAWPKERVDVFRRWVENGTPA